MLDPRVQFVLAVIAALAVIAQIVRVLELLGGHDDVADAQQRRQERVALGLLEHALARVDEHDGRLRGRGAGDHVARVLHVAGRVGEDEAPPRGGEVAVGDVDGDPLLALGAQAVGEQREVDRAVAVAPAAGLGHVLELVGEHGLGVVEQAADQRRLAVVDRSRRGQPEQIRHQK